MHGEDMKLVVFSTVLALLFSLALLYATFEVPLLVRELLLPIFPDYSHGTWNGARAFLEMFRPVGYVAFIVTLALIVTGFALKRTNITRLGSFLAFLPTFGYFACTMFFLAGIGILRLPLLPIMDASRSLLALGNAVFLPLIVVIGLPLILIHWTAGISVVSIPIAEVLVWFGSFIFFLGVVAWLYGRMKGAELVDFWIYRYSRHPQYLGFLIWSYGLLVHASLIGAPMGGYVPPPSLPWLIVALAIIAVALREENIMVEKFGESYMQYRRKTPFLLPLPKKITSLITAPVSFIFKKDVPENGKEIALTVAVYGLAIVVLSLPFNMIFPWWF